MTIKNRFPDVAPTLNLDFANSKRLDPRITFTRASTGTYVDEFGIIRTAAANQARFDHDGDGNSLGLLIEESRTNLLLNSGTLATQNVTVTATTYQLSFYGTGSITLSGVSTAGPLVGTGSNSRVVLSFAPTAGTLTLTVAGTVTNAQLETGSFPTSYIPTTGSTATRSAEVANMTGTNFSSWYNQSEGTAVVKYKFLSQLQFTSPFAFRASTGVDVASWGYWTYTGGSQVRVPSFGKRTPNEANTLLGTFFTLDTNRYYTVAVAQSGLSMSGCIETGTTQPLAITAMTTMNVLNFGWIRSTSQPMTGHIARLAYYDRRLTDAQLQALTL